MDKWLVHSCNRMVCSSETEQTTSTNNCGWNSQTWYWLGEAGQKWAHWSPGKWKKQNKSRPMTGVRDRVQFRVGGWGQVMQGSMRGLRERLSFHFWIWMPATWVFLNIHGVVHCWQVHNFVCFLLEWKVNTYHLDTAAFNAVPGSLW